MDQHPVALNLMRRSFALCAPWVTVCDAIRVARQEGTANVVVASSRPLGFVSIETLLASSAASPVREVMSPIACVAWDASADHIRHALLRSDVVAVTSGHAVFGVFTSDDVRGVETDSAPASSPPA